MSDEERLLWALGIGAVLFWLISSFKRWWRRWRNNRARRKFEGAARTRSEGNRMGHVAARYKRWDTWLEKIGYPRRGGKSNQD